MTTPNFLIFVLATLFVNVVVFLLDFRYKKKWYLFIRLFVFILFSSIVIKFRPQQHPILGKENVVLLSYCLTFLLLILIFKGKTVFSEYWINKLSR